MSKKTVIIAEKYSQVVDFYAPTLGIEHKEKHYYVLKPSESFPKGAILTWASGHLVELKLPKEYKEEWSKWDIKNLPIIPKRFEYKVKEGRHSQFNAIKKLLNDADVVVNACDPDREGSNIFYSILHMAGAKNKIIKRLWVNSMTASTLKKGFNNLLDNEKDYLIYKEAQTRQFGDWLVGINASQLFSLSLQKKGINDTFPVGRVQTPTVYMIYKRQQEIENFVSKPYYELFASFEHTKGNYQGKAKIKTDTKDEIESILKDKDLIELKHDEAVIKKVEKELKYTKAPKLHSLSTLQVKANKKWKYESSKTLSLVQSLYEKKMLSYPRTESNFITKGEYEYLKDNLEGYKKILDVSFDNNYNVTKKHVNDSKVQEHYAIIPTDEVPKKSDIDNLSKDEKNIYYEVLKTTLAMFHQDYEYEETIIVTDVKGIDFITKGKIEVKKGWKELFTDEKQEKNDNGKKTDSKNTLPVVFEKDLVLADLKVKEGFTTPPKAFTEGTIINAMKNAGRMVENSDDSDILKEVEGIGTNATRASIIDTIKKHEYIVSKNNIFYVTEKGKVLCESVEGTLLSSPSMTAKWEEYLNKIGNGEGSQNTFLTNIEKFINDLLNKSDSLLEGVNVTSLMKDQKDNEGIVECPKCNEGTIRRIKTKKGSFYGCSNYKNDCRMTFPTKIANKTLTENMIKTICSKGITSKIKGFKNKKGKKFDAKLKLNNEYNIEFEF